MRHLLILLLSLSVSIAADSAAPSKSLNDLPYVAEAGSRQRLDLVLPPKVNGQKPPLIVWIHGGGWEGGAKSLDQSGFLKNAGFAVAAINYRLSDQAPFPAQILDCKAAIRWLRAHADEYGYDGTRIGVWGHSAGGHLVALLGTSGGTREFDQGENTGVSSNVQAVVDIDGPVDLSFYGERKTGPIAKLLGGPLSEKSALAQQANPIRYASADDPPFLILHVEKDTLVPSKHGAALYAALKATGIDATLHISPGEGHYPQEQGIDQKILAFFQRTLGFTLK